MGFHPAIRRIRPGRVGRPVCDEARGISPALFSRQHPFLIFFQRSTGRQKTQKKDDSGFFGPVVGARVRPTVVGGKAGYTPTYSGMQADFGRKR